MPLSAASALHYWSSRYGHVPIVGGKPTHSRGSTARLIDIASQHVVEVPAATPRDTHLITIDGEDRPGLLLEMARTNRLTYSEDFSSWSGASVVTAGHVDPEGGTNARLINTTVAGDNRYLFFTITGGDGSKFLSIYVKKGTASSSQIGLYDEAIGNWRTRADIAWTAAGVPTFTIGAGTGGFVSTEALANGWYRMRLQCTNVVGANSHRIIIYSAAGGTGTMYVFGAQFEEDTTSPSSYIRTTGAIASRSADTLYWDYAHPPQAKMVYLRFLESGSKDKVGYTLVHIAGGGAGVFFPAFSINQQGGFYTAYHRSAGGTVVQANLGVLPAYGDVVELIGVLNADGSVAIYQSVNGSPVTSATNATTLALPSAWAGTRLYLANDGDAPNIIHAAELKIVKYSDVVGATAQDRMNELRSFEIGPNRELLAAA